MNSNRRGFIQKGALIGATALAGATSALAKSKRFRWRLVMAIPKTLPIWGEGVVQFAKDVKAMTNGQLDIRVYGAGELVPALGVFDAVTSGQVQMGHAASYYWQGKIPSSVFFCSVPFGLSTNGMRAWLASGGSELWEEAYRPHGILPMSAGATGAQMGGWFNKEIKSAADFKGLKMRIPGLGGKVLAAMGGKPILMAGGEIFTNLSTGVIDATEWVGPYHDYVMGFHKAAKFYYYPGWHEPGPILELMINRKEWEKLPKDIQLIVRTAAAALDRDMHAKWLAKDAAYLEKIKKEGKVSLMAFPKDVIAKARELADSIKREHVKSDPLGQKVYASYKAFQLSFDAHNSVTESALI
ncbi:MAG: TRAP transporter substrate-binding protein DctP [Pseudobacteriovorax sp.]|nr:TRAP transporter substrate-binding protein DctP [Pseudobacteriovorax sp.]